MKKYLSLCLILCCLVLQIAGCGMGDYQRAGEQLMSEILEYAGIESSEPESEVKEEKETKSTEKSEDERKKSVEQKLEVKGQKSTEEEKKEEKKEKKEEETEIPETDPAYAQNYAYTTLNNATRKVYGEVYETIMDHKEDVEVSTLDLEVLENAYDAVCADHGGLFWVSGYVYTQYTIADKLVSIEFTPKYTMDYEKREKVQERIDGMVEKILSKISASDSDYDKAKFVFETLIKNVDYDISAEDNQNIISVFLNRATVCQGYANATQYLLEKLGIQSTVVKGFANGESHAWNLVRLDGEYYYMDTTWGNSRYRDTSSEEEKYVNYSYMAVSSEEISRTHTLDNSFSLPECTSMNHNYFVREGRYFTEWNPEAIGALLAEVWNNGGSEIALKFSSPNLYERTIEYFVSEQHIADYCENITSVYYLTDEEQYVVTFQF